MNDRTSHQWHMSQKSFSISDNCDDARLFLTSDNVTQDLWPLCYVTITLLVQSHTEFYEGKCWQRFIVERQICRVCALCLRMPHQIHRNRRPCGISSYPYMNGRTRQKPSAAGGLTQCLLRESEQGYKGHKPGCQQAHTSLKLMPCQQFCGVLRMNFLIKFYFYKILWKWKMCGHEKKKTY